MCPSEVSASGSPGYSDPEAARAGAILTIDLGALAENYRRLRAELNGVPCAAVVKADGYGLGLARVAPALFQAMLMKLTNWVRIIHYIVWLTLFYHLFKKIKN